MGAAHQSLGTSPAYPRTHTYKTGAIQVCQEKHIFQGMSIIRLEMEHHEKKSLVSYAQSQLR